MNVFFIFLGICASLIGVGFAMDVYAKKKGSSVGIEPGMKNKSMNQTLHREESIQNAKNHTNPHSF